MMNVSPETAQRAAQGPDGNKKKILFQEGAKPKELLLQMHDIISSLSLQTLFKQVAKIKKLPIETEGHLKLVVDFIYETAITNSRLCELCAHLCLNLSEFSVPSPHGKEGVMTFSKLLLKRCQKDFEENQNDIVEQKKSQLDATAELLERLVLMDELEDAKFSASRLSFGNIQFIGELFKVGIVHENVMHSCISKLLNDRNKESMKRLCRLMYVAGELLYAKSKPIMDKYFDFMKRVIKEGLAPSAIISLMKGLVDLQENTWTLKMLRATQKDVLTE